jgi:hypothetical protein
MFSSVSDDFEVGRARGKERVTIVSFVKELEVSECVRRSLDCARKVFDAESMIHSDVFLGEIAI